MKYETTERDKWIRPIKTGYKMACCDCGLVHEIDFKIEDDRVWIRSRRNNRSTAMIRRYMKSNVEQEEKCYPAEFVEWMLMNGITGIHGRKGYLYSMPLLNLPAFSGVCTINNLYTYWKERVNN